MEEPMLNQHPSDPTPFGSAGRLDKRKTAFVYLFINFAIMAYNSWSSMWILAFVAPAYVLIVMMFWLADQKFQRKGVAWIYVALILTATTIGWIILHPMSWYLKSFIWVVNSSIVVVGFYFIYLLNCGDAELDSKLDSDHHGGCTDSCVDSPEENA